MRTAILALAVCAGTALAAESSTQRRVAVMDFDNPPLPQSPLAGFVIPGLTGGGMAANVGRSIADLLVDRLVRNAQVRVIERKELDKLISEQNLSNSDRVDANTAARLGRILGVDAIIMGSVTRYDPEDRTTGHGNTYGGFRTRSALQSTHEISGHVQISARVVSPDTAEILAVDQGNGEAVRKGVKMDARDRMYGANSVSGSVLSDATNLAVTELATHLEQSIAKVPPHSANISALVAGINSAGLVVINAGSRRGVKIGDRFNVFRPGNPIRDPETGKVLRSDEQHLGEATIKDVDEISAAASYTGEPVREGDHVQKVNRP